MDDYRFIVVNKETLTPLVWKCEFTKTYGMVEFHTDKNKDIYLEDPFTLGAELDYYLKNHLTVPVGIDTQADNSISKFINSM